jgi:glycosyltransferase involved in cell wall biosynthesis
VNKVLFHRHFDVFTGGHLKLYDYTCHVDESGFAESNIYMDPRSRANHLWKGHPGLMDDFQPERADVIFLAGRDWMALDRFPGIEERLPVVNLIQHVRHANPDQELYTFLARRATRICVSHEVAEAILSTGRCNGPVHVIENGIDLAPFLRTQDRTVDVLIVGLKQPSLACALAERLAGLSLEVQCLVEREPRDTFLQRMNQARIVVTLPNRTEGFYLPALEAMSLECAVVCPDCVGNRGFCVDGVTCLMPEFTLDGLERSVSRLLSDNDLVQKLKCTGKEKVKAYDLMRERREFLHLLAKIVQ